MTRLLYPSASIGFLFLVLLPYNGAGVNIQWLSTWAVLFVLFFAVSLGKQDLTRFNWPAGWIPTVAILYVGWLLIAPFVSTYPYASTNAAWALAVLPLTLLGWLLIPNNDDQTWQWTWWAILLPGVALALWGLIDLFLLSTRSHGPLIDANAYAALINLFLVPTVFFYLTVPTSQIHSSKRYVLLGIASLLAMALFASFSRGAALTLLAILPFVLWFSRGANDFRSRIPWLLLVLIASYAMVKIGPVDTKKGIEALVLAPSKQLESDRALSARLLVWKSTWKIFQNSNPIVGTGLGTYKNYYAAYREEMETSGNLAHNDYLQALQEGGLIQLSFFVVLTIFAPIWIIYRLRSQKTTQRLSNGPPIGTGLMLGILCVALHAVFNFIHFVAPIAMLTGLYLGRAWNEIRSRHTFCLMPTSAIQIKPAFVKYILIMLLAVPTMAVLLNGAIFKLFHGNNANIDRFDPATRMTIRNLAIVFRPNNPYPRISLINDLLTLAQLKAKTAEGIELLNRAETEANILVYSAPGVASNYFIRGKIRAIKGEMSDLILARGDLEYAVRHVPPATGMRLELVKLYLRMGQQSKALETIRDAKKWVQLAADPVALIAFAETAHVVARAQNDQNEADYWLWIMNSVAPTPDKQG